ncbi:MarR family winged helix-turn-helix transcriptional regulator [Phenylobacterium sp.]|uniref:MarR family winged helix-turn-helix transcriptional regulator n=1 Tax=Phenylobacterium sp. TaxID=1871053 RepID=UPI0025E7D87A|nr:MarR family winged helix-turn-helix transcriptional regulator [Phenylobacterium sp.]MCA3721346.1 winged helix-turn-helix transcriptional regulator [Phenylobacterium sp.]
MTDRYPAHPGSKGTDGTSQAAAAAMARHARPLQWRALETLGRIGPATALEVCEASKVAREAMHPRLSELRVLGHVEPTGERRRNPSGKSAAILRMTERGAAFLRKEGGTAS